MVFFEYTILSVKCERQENREEVSKAALFLF